jgi:hypothetical protein
MKVYSRKNKDDRYLECTICGLVVADVVVHLNYSHPKIKAFCTDCNGSGRNGITTNNKDGTFSIYDCSKCKGSGAYETEDRK